MLLKHFASKFGILFLILLCLILPSLVHPYFLSLMTLTFIYSIFAISIDILAGYAGRTSLCHGAIFGTAAYTAIYCVTVDNYDPYTAVLLGIGMSTLIGLVFAVLAVRTSGVYFLLLTLALGMIVWGVCQRWTSVTGGENGLRGNIRPDWLQNPEYFYYFSFIVLLVVGFAILRFVKSPFGLTLRGIRESESRMRSLGYNTTLHLIIGFVISSFVAGIAGVLYALFNSFVSSSSVSLAQSVKGLLMAIMGGVGTVFGGVVGSALIISLENIISSYTERWSFVMGFMFVLAMIFIPEGIVGKLKISKK
jgi:branched-chain amino acid transport system permease protein